MKKIAARIVTMILVAALVLSGFNFSKMPVYAATASSINDSDVWLKQGSRECVITSAAMIMRRYCILRGDSNWRDIVVDSQLKYDLTGSTTGKSMKFTPVYTKGGRNIRFDCQRLSTDNATKKQELISLLQQHPEGILIWGYYATNAPHGIVLTDYTNGTFYVADPANCKPNGRIPLSSAYGIDTLGELRQYWNITGSDITATVGHYPEGNLDVVQGEKGSITLWGWAFDEDAYGKNLSVEVYIGGPAGSTGSEKHVLTADKPRPDVNAAYSNVPGPNHGFEAFNLKTNKRGKQTVYVYAVDTGNHLIGNKLLGTRTVNIGNPGLKSYLNPVTAGTGTVSVSGYAYDPDATTSKLNMEVWIGGPRGSGAEHFSFVADQESTVLGEDVGKNHAFRKTFQVKSSGEKDVYVYAAFADGSEYNQIGKTQTVDIKPLPVTYLWEVTGKAGAVFVSGYAYDESALSKALNIEVWIGGDKGSDAEHYSFVANDESTTLSEEIGKMHAFRRELRVKATGNQQVYIYAYSANNTAYTQVGTVRTVTIAEAVPESIALNKSTLRLEAGNSQSLKATILPENAANKEVTWGSSDTAVATVDAQGNVRAVSSGTATITATTKQGSKKATCTVTVYNKPKGYLYISEGGAGSVYVTGWAFDPDEPKKALTVEVWVNGEKGSSAEHYSFTADEKSFNLESTHPEAGAYHAFRKSINVNATGLTQIYVYAIDSQSSGEYTMFGKASVNVGQIVAATGISLDKTNLQMELGDTANLKATVAPSNATNQSVSWSSSNKWIVEVDNAGKLTAKKQGTATITAQSADGEYTAECTVTVVPKPTISVENDTYELKEGTTLRIPFSYTGEGIVSAEVTSADSEKVLVLDSSQYDYVNKTGSIDTCALREGETELTIKLKTSDNKVAVQQSIPVIVSGSMYGISFGEEPLQIHAGETKTFTYTFTGRGVYHQGTEIESGKVTENNRIGSFDFKRELGTYEVTITAGDAIGTDTYTVTLKDNMYKALYHDSMDIVVLEPKVGPEITEQPESITSLEGEEITLRVSALGTGLEYQWQYKEEEDTEWTDWVEGQEAVQVSSIDMNDRVYRVSVTDSDHNTTESDEFEITVYDQPEISLISLPEDLYTTVGDQLVLQAEAAGEDLTYTWQWHYAGGTTWNSWGHANPLVKKMYANFDGIVCRYVVTDSEGHTATSNEATLHVEEGSGFGITKQPEDITAAVGDVVELVGEAQGSEVTYTWQWHYAGATTWNNWGTSDTLSKKMYANFDGIVYRFIAEDENGASVTSDEATLHVTSAPPTLTITTQPQDVNATVGETVTLSAAANGDEVKYLWQWHYAGATSWNSWGTAQTLNKKMYANFDGIVYRYVVTDKYGNSVTSDEATLHVTSAPPTLTITTQPQDVNATVGETVTLSAAANGDEVKYLWQWHYAGATSWNSWGTVQTLNKKMYANFDGIVYRFVATDKYGNSVTSDEATIHVTSTPPSPALAITQEPSDITGAVGETVTLTGEASGDEVTYTWQWHYADRTTWSNWGSANPLNKKLYANFDGIVYRFVAKDKNGNSITSNEATLHVTSTPPEPAVKITQQPEDISGLVGETVTLTGAAEGNEITYTWQWHYADRTTWSSWGSAIPLSKKLYANFDGIVYRFIAADKDGNSVTSNEATLHVTTAPVVVITQQPESVTAELNSSVTFTIEATGEELSYQWQYHYPDRTTWTNWGTGSRKTCTARSNFDGLSVRCIVTDKYGQKVISEEVTLTVGTPEEPESTMMLLGAKRAAVPDEIQPEESDFEEEFADTTAENPEEESEVTILSEDRLLVNAEGTELTDKISVKVLQGERLGRIKAELPGYAFRKAVLISQDTGEIICEGNRTDWSEGNRVEFEFDLTITESRTVKLAFIPEETEAEMEVPETALEDPETEAENPEAEAVNPEVISETPAEEPEVQNPEAVDEPSGNAETIQPELPVAEPEVMPEAESSEEEMPSEESVEN